MYLVTFNQCIHKNIRKYNSRSFSVKNSLKYAWGWLSALCLHAVTKQYLEYPLVMRTFLCFTGVCASLYRSQI